MWTYHTIQKSPSPWNFVIDARRGGTGTDLSKVPQFKRHANDCGSSEVQIARLTARITQLSSHLQEHKQGHAAKRGLLMIIGKRSSLLRYLQRSDRLKYRGVCATLGIKTSLTSAN